MAKMNCVYVETNLGTHLVVLVHDHETISDFKERLCKEHHQCFPKLGEIHISAVKVKRQKTVGLLLDYHLPDSMFLSKAFEGVSHNCWFVFVDADKNCLNLEKEDKEIATLLDGNQNPEEDLESERAEKTTKKREVELSDGEKSGKKRKVATPESSSPKDEALTGKEIEMGAGRDKTETVSHTANHLDTEKKKKNISKDDVNQSSAANVDATPESLPTSKGENLDVPFAAEATLKDIVMGRDHQTDLGSHNLDTKKKGSKSKDDINQPCTTNVDFVDDSFETLPVPRGAIPFAEETQKENEMAEVFVEDDNIETSSGSRPDTEKTEESGEKIDEIVGGEPSAADNIQPCNVEIDAESMKPTKKSKSPAEEDTASDVEENGKKDSSQVVSAEVNSTALEETSPVNTTKDTETDTDASPLQKCSEEKPDQVVGGVESKNDKSGLHLHPISRVQQSASSGTYRLRSRVKSVGSESMGAQSQDDDSPVDCVPDTESE